jgi:hypothetical protein
MLALVARNLIAEHAGAVGVVLGLNYVYGKMIANHRGCFGSISKLRDVIGNVIVTPSVLSRRSRRKPCCVAVDFGGPAFEESGQCYFTLQVSICSGLLLVDKCGPVRVEARAPLVVPTQAAGAAHKPRQPSRSRTSGCHQPMPEAADRRS